MSFVAVAIAGTGAATAGVSAANGKKGSSTANKQLALQQQAFNAGQKLINTGLTEAWQPSADYWNSLLKGGTAAVQAVGPYADLLRQNQASTASTLNALPLGGGRNLALTNNALNTSNNIARLIQGVQPTAASALGSLAGTLTGAGTSVTGIGAPNVSAGLKAQNNANQQIGQATQGLGSLLYNAINKPTGNGAIVSAPSVPFTQYNVGGTLPSATSGIPGIDASGGLAGLFGGG